MVVSLNEISSDPVEIVGGSSPIDENRDSVASRIPVENWWRMLLYSCELLELGDQFDARWKNAPDIDALLSYILVEYAGRQVRRGLRGDYVDRSEALRTVRGKIDFNRTLSDLLIYKGQLHCEYQEYSINVPRNQIIATTLQKQLRRPFNGFNRERVEELKTGVERLVRTMDEIDRIGLDIWLFSNEVRKLGPNEREYKLILRVCELLYRPRIPTESEDQQGESFVDWVRDRESNIFESFVANFLKLRLPSAGWDVKRHDEFDWHVTAGNVEGNLELPKMIPDVVLKHDSGKIIVLDTKWYGDPFKGRFNDDRVNSPNLYQMYSYLASQNFRGTEFEGSTGILLYGHPGIKGANLEAEIDGHPILVETLDMQKDWEEIENDLVELIEETVHEREGE